MRIDVMTERNLKGTSHNDVDHVLVVVTTEDGYKHHVTIEKAGTGDTPEVRIIEGDECIWSVIDE